LVKPRQVGSDTNATMIDKDTRVRAAREIAKTETEASVEVFHTLKRRGHPEAHPPTIFTIQKKEKMICPHKMIYS